jgi:hypothetical protein
MKMMNVAELRSFRIGCAWDGCRQSFKGAMPRNWQWLVSYWARVPQLALGPTPEMELDCDAALCPTHVRALSECLYPMVMTPREDST